MDIPKNEGAIYNKGRAFIEYSKIKEAKTVNLHKPIGFPIKNI